MVLSVNYCHNDNKLNKLTTKTHARLKNCTSVSLFLKPRVHIQKNNKK